MSEGPYNEFEAGLERGTKRATQVVVFLKHVVEAAEQRLEGCARLYDFDGQVMRLWEEDVVYV
jgi:hypothetical protein